jgi:hypothetical protein
VLLDDRIAEHVPGCNMAFRRNALLAIDGFNPIYLRAGDDVDVCWRLQARGWKIGFASAALVWHHHRSSLNAYWKQQVGYGEGETWLMAHHPDKFLDGRMLWRGRIYSPLPFVRSLWGTRINAGVWGTAAFPSVYRTDVHPFAFLPHSMRWQVLSFVLTIFGGIVTATRAHGWAATLLLGTGLVGIAATISKNIAYALRSEVDSLRGSKTWYRAIVAYLHFIQPIARVRGRIRGVLSPPQVRLPVNERQTSHGPRPSLSEAWRALLLISGNVTEDRFWSEVWTSSDRVLTQFADWLRRSRAVRTIEIDEGWSDDRDVSVFVGRWAWLDIRALVRLGDAYAQIGQWNDALAVFQRASQRAPQDFAVLTKLAICFERVGDLSNAISIFDRAIKIRPDSLETQQSLASALAMVGRIAESNAEFLRILRENPRWEHADQVHLELGMNYEKIGDKSAAITHYQQALALHPSLTLAQKRLADLGSADAQLNSDHVSR